jgi:hypothetical protein
LHDAGEARLEKIKRLHEQSLLRQHAAGIAAVDSPDYKTSSASGRGKEALNPPAQEAVTPSVPDFFKRRFS